MIEVENNEASSKSEKDKDHTDGDFNNIKLKKSLTFNEIFCTAVLFLSAGYETTGITLCFIAYNLAKNQDVQEKLCQEIDQVLDNYVINCFVNFRRVH